MEAGSDAAMEAGSDAQRKKVLILNGRKKEGREGERGVQKAIRWREDAL